jgi:ABC-type dipeptide/oligopeptide/nickel transport system permease subunit
MSLSSDHAVETVPHAAETQEIAGRSLTELAWSRLRRDKVAMASMTILLIVIGLAIFAPLICRLIGVEPTKFYPETVSDSGGLPLGRWGGISAEHPLGVEPSTGYDIFARLLYGSRVSLLIAFTGTLITLVLGVVIGIIAGYSRGWLDTALGRLMDIILAFPLLLILLALSQPLTQRLEAIGLSGAQARIAFIVLVLSFFGWPYLARIIRGQVLSLREREFVEAAVAMGSGKGRILFTEILPNLWAPILVYTTLALPAFIGLEAALSFLGVGVLPPDVTFGAMLANSVRYFERVPTYLFIPGISLVVIVVAFNLLGDSLRDALDPRATH